ncbi:MAG TPA: DNA polymerase [Treponema sp.]|nr:MAG: hypothetical protein A2001_13005 [Treponema sp. GWC1_61_84]HCM27047.1 DNA polymerase [Treponema sp.]
MKTAASVVHLNVIDFPASVAVAADRSLADRAFVVALASSARAVVLDVSRRAREEGLAAGMPLAAAERRVKGLLVLPPDPRACERTNALMESIAARFAPLVQNDSGGHLYLDLAGTSRLFGPHVDCAVRIRNEILEAAGLEPTVALARNRLVAKVATRSIRPAGIAYIREGDEAAFLAPQDAFLLPGVGPAVARVLSVAGLREIGELALLSDEEARALFGKRGCALRDAARGIDESSVAPGGLDGRLVRRRLDFSADVLDESVIRGAIVALAEDAGLELRLSRLAASRLGLSVSYADGARGEAEERSRRPLVLDAELIAAADRAYSRAAFRRVRVRSLSLALSGLAPARREPDLFIPEGPSRLERLQDAVDASRRRFGPAAVTRAVALAAAGVAGAAGAAAKEAGAAGANTGFGAAGSAALPLHA